jgi:hypothetical protein
MTLIALQAPAFADTAEGAHPKQYSSRVSRDNASDSGTPARSSERCCAGKTLDEAEDFTFAIPEPGCDPKRFLQARYLIEENRDFIRNGKALHEKMQQQILIAKTLKGSANMMQNGVPAVAPPKLSGAALQSAMREYTKDLQTFVNHADRYKYNLNVFRTTIGECQRAQATYDQQRQLYDLHCNQFHVNGLNTIEPPHICGALQATAGEASHIANMLRADEQKLAASMQELRNNNALVQESRNMVAANLAATANESVRQREEEKLAREFGRLREEYEMLKIQSKMLGGEKQKEAGKLIRRSVQGNLVK